MVTLIGDQLLESLKKSTKIVDLKDTSLTISGISGNPLQVSTSVQARIKVSKNGVARPTRLLVIKGNELLIGLDTVMIFFKQLNFEHSGKLFPEISATSRDYEKAILRIESEHPDFRKFSTDLPIITNDEEILLKPNFLKSTKNPVYGKFSMPKDAKAGFYHCICLNHSKKFVVWDTRIYFNPTKHDDLTIPVMNLSPAQLRILPGALKVTIKLLSNKHGIMFNTDIESMSNFVQSYNITSADIHSYEPDYNFNITGRGKCFEISAQGEEIEVPGYELPDVTEETLQKDPIKQINWEQIGKPFHPFADLLFKGFKEILARHEFDIAGMCTLVGKCTYSFDEKILKSLRQPKAYPLPADHRAALRQLLMFMQQVGVLERVDASKTQVLFASPCFMVPKPNGKLRLVV